MYKTWPGLAWPGLSWPGKKYNLFVLLFVTVVDNDE